MTALAASALDSVCLSALDDLVPRIRYLLRQLCVILKPRQVELNDLTSVPTGAPVLADASLATSAQCLNVVTAKLPTDVRKP